MALSGQDFRNSRERRENKNQGREREKQRMDLLDAFAQLLVPLALTVAIALKLLRYRRSRCCYLVDYSCYHPPDERKLNTETSIYYTVNLEPVLAERLDLQWRVHLRSGLGEETCVSRFILSENRHATLDEAREETEEAFTAVLDDLFAKTGVKPAQIDILIVNISTFSPAPSPASWVVHRYKMRDNIKAFNLSGMGCAANVIGVDMARDLLSLNPESYALVVGTETITINANYAGRDKCMMITNCLFRVGGNAVLLSNRPGEARRARMRLRHVVRTTYAAADDAFGCVVSTEDDSGIYGISLQPCLIQVAGEAVRRNLTELGPKVLPLRELLRYAYYNMLLPRLRWLRKTDEQPEQPARAPYVPNFRSAFEHFCIHPGGRAVINGVGKNLGLTDYDLEASRMALHRFGNTSTSGIWYEAAYLDAKRRLRRGDRLWQIALGSGFKCNSAVWEVLREADPQAVNVWDDVIHRYPCNTRNRFTDEYCRGMISYFQERELGKNPPPPYIPGRAY